jgi:UPF0755 protein
MTTTKTSTGTFKKFIIVLVVIGLIALAGTFVFYYLKYFGPNVSDKEEYLYIQTGQSYDDVYSTIREKGIVNDTANFNWAAVNMKYTGKVKPGRYRLTKGMSNRKFINMLLAGNQEAVNLSFRGLRLKEQFAGFIAKKLEPDSIAFIRLLDSADYAKQYGFTTDNIYTVFMPDTYDVYWNTTPEKFFKRMYDHYKNFWTAERKQKAEAINLTPVQVSILASIVDAEALHDDEMPTIAGLYLNRLKKGQKLESDPTIIFGIGDFTIRRVLNRDKVYNSPYNTYLHTGLPPGPIMMPSVNAVNAVLNYKSSNYIYMCAKEDFSGYHNFAVNLADHEVNARKFQRALDQRNIKR